MASLASPGVSVTVIDESQYASNATRSTIPLFVLVTHQDKANVNGTGVAEFTTKANANDPKLITSPRELIQQFGSPVFYDISGTIQQGYELNEYGLLAAYKTLNVTNQIYVVRGDVDLAALSSSSFAPSSPPLDKTYWFDINDTKYGIFKFVNGVWNHVIPTVISDDIDLTGASPKASFGKNGDVAIVVVNNSSTLARNQIWEKIGGSWYIIGSSAWDSTTNTVANGTIGFTSASNTLLSGIPSGGDTISVKVGSGAAVVTTLQPVIAGNAVVNNTGNLLGLKTFVGNTETITFGSATAGTITGTATHANTSVATAASCGDIIRITDWNGSNTVSDTVTLRIRLTGTTAFPAAGSSQSFQINNQTVTTGSGIANAVAASVAINAVVGTGGTNPQGIRASAALVVGQDEGAFNAAGSNGTFTAGTGYVASDKISLTDGSVITVDAVNTGAITEFTVTSAGSTGFTSLSSMAQISTTGSGTGFTLTPGSANAAIQLSKNAASSGESLPDQIKVDLTNLSTAFEASPDVFPASTVSETTNLSVSQCIAAINQQVNINTDNITASVGTSSVLVISDSTTAIQLSNVSGTPLSDFGLATATSIPVSTVVSQLSTLTNLVASGSTGTTISLTYSGTGTYNISSGSALPILGFNTGNHGVSLNQVVSQLNTIHSSDPYSQVVVRDSLNYITITDMSSNETFTIAGTGATKLGLPANIAKNALFYAPHYSVPAASEGDFWVKTTNPNNGASYVIKMWNDLLGQWELVPAPLYENNNVAFDAYSSLPEGRVYVQYDVDQDATATQVIKRYNGSSTLEIDVDANDFTAGTTIRISNGRAALASVSVSSLSDFVMAINTLAQANLSAFETDTGMTIVNTIGEDIVLADDASTVSAVFSTLSEGRYSNWVALRNYVSGSVSGYVISDDTPSNAPVEGALWYNGGISADETDLLVHNGTTWVTFTGEVLISATRPSTRSDGSSVLENNDIWIDTSDLEAYPKMSRWNNSTKKWTLIDNTDQTTPNGIIFADARPSATENLDPDCPNPNVYPVGMLLWNTRASSMVVKEFKSDWFGGSESNLDSYDDTDYTVNGYDVGNDSYPALTDIARWVTISGNALDGSANMGRHAQRAVIVRSLAAALQVEELRDIRRKYFNVMLTPGYPELIDEMVALNIDRKETAFIIGDVPMRLRNVSSDIQDWATNADNASSNGDDGLITGSDAVGLYYPPTGLTTNLNGAEVAVPSSLGGMYAFLYNDNVAYPWYAPAGLNRGLLSGVFASVGYITEEDEYRPVSLSEGMEDVLYTNKINPIVYSPSRGLYINGQKTLSPTTSVMDRVNVSRLICYLRYNLEIIAEEFLFEPNDQLTRDQVKNTFDKYLADLLGLRALYDYVTVCDLTNNTPQRIDANELWINVYIQPMKAAEFIQIPITLVNTGENMG